MCVCLLSGAGNVVYSGFMRALSQKTVAAVKNDAFQSSEMNQNSKVVGYKVTTMHQVTLRSFVELREATDMDDLALLQSMTLLYVDV